jgi:hypothetical protein
MSFYPILEIVMDQLPLIGPDTDVRQARQVSGLIWMLRFAPVRVNPINAHLFDVRTKPNRLVHFNLSRDWL